MASSKAVSSKSLAPTELFNIKNFIKDTVTLPVDQLAIDTDLTKGQVRKVDISHVADLMKELRQNPPMQIQLTTWASQGVQLML